MMKKILIIIATFQIFTFCQKDCKKPLSNIVKANNCIAALNPYQFSELLLRENVQLVDVRTILEYGYEHIAGSTNIDLYNADFDLLLSSFKKSEPVLLYCASGTRSEVAMNKIKEIGFSKVYHLDGGIRAWRSAELPLEKN